jgi:hypothetical protein
MHPAATICRYGIPLFMLCSSSVIADSGAARNAPGWSAQLYGGNYYDDRRIGAYLVTSKSAEDGLATIGEVLHEQYSDYRFSGIGGHILWPTENWGDLGFIGSQAWEVYAATNSPEEHYQTRLLGAEWEYNQGRFALAAQAGKYLKDYSGREHSFLSVDAYLSGESEGWYLLLSTRRIGKVSLDSLDVYRNLSVGGHQATIYAGVSRDRLNSITPDGTDSAYVGTYFSLFSTSQSNLTLWFDLSKGESDTLYALELNLTFGPGTRAPYMTAFGNSISN